MWGWFENATLLPTTAQKPLPAGWSGFCVWLAYHLANGANRKAYFKPYLLVADTRPKPENKQQPITTFQNIDSIPPTQWRTITGPGATQNAVRQIQRHHALRFTCFLPGVDGPERLSAGQARHAVGHPLRNKNKRTRVPAAAFKKAAFPACLKQSLWKTWWQPGWGKQKFIY